MCFALIGVAALRTQLWCDPGNEQRGDSARKLGEHVLVTAASVWPQRAGGLAGKAAVLVEQVGEDTTLKNGGDDVF